MSPHTEHRQETHEQALRAALGDINPMKHAGEGWHATDEIARPEDVMDEYLRGEVGNEHAYYPPPDTKRSMRRY